jgi:SAM-dependent methyltransferase
MDAADTQTCGPRYLSAKQTVDDRALNRGVMERLRQEIQTTDRPLRVVEIGAGIGTMAARLCDWQVLRRADYRLVDVDPDLLAAGRVWLRTWGEGRGHAVVTDGDALRIHGPDVDLRLSFQTAELGALLARPSGEPADLLVANAFLDLVEVPVVLPGLFDLIVPGGLYLFTINFDGETVFQPEHPDDPMLMHAYHRCMDQRVRFGRPAGESKAGRHLFGHLRAAGASILAAGASDWVVHPGQPDDAGYPADEAFFLHTILDTIAQALAERPEIRPDTLAAWIGLRRQQIQRAELVFLAHQLDFCGRRPFKKPPQR